MRFNKTGFFRSVGFCMAAVLAFTVFFGNTNAFSTVVKADSNIVNYEAEGGSFRFDKATGFVDKCYDKSVTKVVIPEKIEGVTVKGISEWAFYELHDLKTVVLPKSLEVMEKGCFYGCDALTEITVPEGITELKDMTFYECRGLKKLSMPSSLEIIGKYCFYSCESLEYVDIPGSVYKIGNGAFAGCYSLKGVYFVEGVSIDMGGYVFDDCYALEKAINVPDARWNKFIESCRRAVIYMDKQSLKEHTEMWRLPDDDNAVIRLKNDQIDGVKWVLPDTRAGIEKAFVDKAKEITKGCKTDREKILAIMKWICKNVRYNTEHFTEEKAPNDTRVVSVFNGILSKEGTDTPHATTCGGYSNLTQVFCQALGIPCVTVWREKKQGETIDHEFNMIYFEGKWRWVDTTASDDDSMQKTEPETMEGFDCGTAGFAYSSDHRVDILLYMKPGDDTIYKEIPTDIKLTAETKDWEDQNPKAAYKKGEGYVDPEWVYETDKADKKEEQSKVEQREKEFPSIKTTAEADFDFNSSTGTITGFDDRNAKEISIPETINGVKVKAIGKEAFAYLKNVEYIDMPDSITSIAESAFSGCSSLKRIRLSSGLKMLNTYTFSGCSSLETITIPKNVKRLDGYIFSNCDRLEEILFEDYSFKEACLATDPRGSEDDFAAGIGNISWYAFKDVGKALNGLDFHESYKGSKWHTALQKVNLTGDFRQNILNIYDTQLDYREGFSPYYVSGNNTKEYKTPSQASYWEWGHFSEAGKYHGIDGTTWCYAFTQWNYAMAGIPVTLGSTYYEWKDLTYAGGKYTPQSGDIIGVGKTHVAMVGYAEEKKGYVELQIINGNHPNRNVGKELIRYEKKSGIAKEQFVDGAWVKLSSEDAEDFRIRSIYCPKLEEIKTHTLTLDPGKGKVEYTKRVIAEEAVYGALPDAVLKNYVFDGWYTKKKGGEKVLPYQMFKGKSDQTLYAHYTYAPKAVVSIKIAKSESVNTNETKKLKVTLNPKKPSDTKVTWRSSNSEIVKVSSDGTIKGIAEGTAVIEAKAVGGGDYAYCTVTVTKPGSTGDSGTTSKQDLVKYKVTGGYITFDKSSGTVVSADKTVTKAKIPKKIKGVKVTAIGKEAFYQCKNLKSVTLPKGLKTIGQSAFEETALTKVTVPDTVTRLEKWSFCVNKSLKSIIIGKGVEYIGPYAFTQDYVLETVYFKKDWKKIEIEGTAFPVNCSFKMYKK